MNILEVLNKQTTALIELMKTNFKLKADKTELNSHTGNKSNPHDVNLTQLGVNASATELNHVKGVTSGIQGQLDGKSDSDHTHTVDSSLSSTSTNPVQNKVVKTELDKKATTSALDSHTADTVKHITSTERTTWNNKSDFSGNYNDLEDAPNIVEDGTGTLKIMDQNDNIIMEIGKDGLNVAKLTVNGTGDVATALTQYEEAIDTNKTNIDKKADKTDLTSHIGNKNNPHGVTLSQLGVTASATELNKLKGTSVSTGEIEKLSGVTSNIQTQLDGKAAKSHGNHVPTTETANNAKFLRNDNTWQTVTPANIGASATGHKHTKSEITDFPTSLKNPNSLTIQGNGTTLTNGTYDGSAAKTVNITPASIGAATTTDLATKLNINQGVDNARNHLIVNDSGNIEPYQTPTFDLISIGLPTAYFDYGYEYYTENSDGFKAQLNEIIEALQKGDVRFKVSFGDENGNKQDVHILAKYPQEVDSSLDYFYTGVFVYSIVLGENEGHICREVRWYLGFTSLLNRIYVEFRTLPIDHKHRLEDITDLKRLDAMNLTTAQTAKGVKTFSDGINIGNASLTYDSTNKRLVISVN